MKNPLVKIPLIVLGVAIIASIVWNLRSQPTVQPAAPVTDPAPSTTVPTDNVSTSSMCYYRSTRTASGLYDKDWLTIDVEGQNVTGEYHDIPAEKDATEGTFSGTTTTNDQSPTASKIASLWLSTLAEGTQNKDELLVIYDNSTASVGFGEMIADPDDANTYLYKDATKLTYDTPIPAIDCDSLNEISTVESYIKNNIQAIIGTADTVTPSLAGQAANTWSVTATNVDLTTHTAQVSYTDGHVRHIGTVAYTFVTDGNIVTVTNFTKSASH